MGRTLALSKPEIGFAEYKQVFKALRSGWLTQNGSHCKKMELYLENCYSSVLDQAKLKVCLCSNGSTALHLALLALEIGPGDEVIVPDFGYIAAVNSVIISGATPVLADVNDDWTIDINSIIRSISEKTKAIICIDNYGKLCDYESIRKLIPNRIKIIQDSAVSFPSSSYYQNSEYKGDLITLSFYANKVFTSGEGGAILASSQLISVMNKLKSQNNSQDGSFKHLGLGFNYRITNLQAAIFVSQWEKKNSLMKKRYKIFTQYEKYFSNQSRIINHNLNSNPWLCTIQIDCSPEQREKISQQLRSYGIETRIGFTPASEHSHVKDKAIVYDKLKNSKRISNQIISLPTFPRMSHKDVGYISKKLIAELSTL